MPFLIIVIFFEVLTALIGTMYLKESKYRENNLTRYFVWLLWLTVFVEIVFGLTPRFLSKVGPLMHFKEFLINNNYVVYNIYAVITFLFYVFFFKKNIFSKKISLVLDVMIVVGLVLAGYVLVFTGVDFVRNWPVIDIIGSILIFVSVLLYFLEIFNSDKILSIHKEMSFYIAVGAMVFHLVVTPLFIYEEYSSEENLEFFEVRNIILYSANIFMYTCYIIGFVVCLKKNKSY